MLSKIKLLILFSLLFSISEISAQEILNQKINISKDNYKIGEILKIIEQNNNVKFSFNSELIETEKKIMYSAENKKIKDCLDEIFENKIKYQVSGKHIILLKKILPEEKKQIEKQKITIFGTIINAENSETLSDVSVYDLDKQYSTISNYQGEFNITINSNEEFRGLSLGKTGFYDTIVIINMSETEILNISLRPKETQIETIKPIETTGIKIEKVRTTEIFIPKSTLINSQNLEYIDNTRFAQISFLPGLSSNLSNFGVVKNNVSLNILIGYSRGVKGFETAGLMNFDKENVSGVQLAGLTNTVGGKVTGFQAAGIMNVVLKDIEACQISGIANVVNGNSRGVQIGGIFNSTVGKFNGFQAGGIANLTTKQFKGIQTAGILNIATGGVNGVQTSGILNFNWGDVNGVQSAGLVNFNYGRIIGVQAAGLLNIASDTVKGAQLAGLINLSKINIIQLSGILNVAKENKGLQIGLLNICDTSSGVSIGLFSFVRKGLHKFVISSDEIYYANLNLHLGTDKFYNIFSVSMRPANEISWGYGYGFGHKIRLSKTTKLNLELTSKNINYKKIWNPEVFTYFKFATIFEFRIKNKISIYAGPSVNFYFGDKSVNADTYNFISEINYLPISQKETGIYNYLTWLGFSVGLSL
jgi:hypothetical protein